VIASEILRTKISPTNPLFSTVCKFGNEFAPPAIGLPNLKAFIISDLALFRAFDG
jgi:hypothetical protein